ncbi:tetratricopeptide repeat protein [Pseudomonas sp.]|uniref:tetratricopeptide repeat protein n=1 Tax=Pseudomonas sp. TaxID=306 RepID=UPI0028AC295E|nr:tetratricopeptide repeat protein [Pseudomonas sp.]
MHCLTRRDAITTDQLSARLAGAPREAARTILAAAQTGLADAQVMLGQILLEGRGIQRDAALAVRWFRIARAQGTPMAHNMLGRCLEHGWGCPPNAAAAANEYRLAADQGLDWAMYNLANLLATGRGVEQDQAQALELYRRAAALGHAKSMNLLGRYFEEGLVVAADPAAALDWYRRAAEAGDFRGQFSYAAVLMGLQRWEEARHWLIQALSLGHLAFLRKARDQLLAARIEPLVDVAQAYVARCAAVGDQADRRIARRLQILPSIASSA